MKRSMDNRLDRLQAAIAPTGRTHCFFSKGDGATEAEIAAKQESGEIGPEDRITVVSWRLPRDK